MSHPRLKEYHIMAKTKNSRQLKSPPPPTQGTVFGWWTVLGPPTKTRKTPGGRVNTRYSCRCRCGKTSDVLLAAMRSGASTKCRSCGFKFRVARTLLPSQTQQSLKRYEGAIELFYKHLPHLLDVFAEYVTESLHQGDEFPATITDALFDFGLYLSNGAAREIKGEYHDA